MFVARKLCLRIRETDCDDWFTGLFFDNRRLGLEVWRGFKMGKGFCCHFNTSLAGIDVIVFAVLVSPSLINLKHLCATLRICNQDVHTPSYTIKLINLHLVCTPNVTSPSPFWWPHKPPQKSQTSKLFCVTFLLRIQTCEECNTCGSGRYLSSCGSGSPGCWRTRVGLVTILLMLCIHVYIVLGSFFEKLPPTWRQLVGWKMLEVLHACGLPRISSHTNTRQLITR